MNTELIVLNLIAENDCGGYDIMKRIKEATVNNANIEYGSIYHRIKKAVSDDLIKPKKTIKGQGKPDKIVYQITPKGEKYIKKRFNQYLDKNHIHFDIDILLMFLDKVDQEFIEERMEVVKEKLASINGKKSVLLSYLEYHLKAEMAWLKSLQK